MKLLATLAAFLFSGIVAATPLHNVVVFGDSLSDNGNLYDFMKHQIPQSPPYFEGRFSNGPVWIELLMASYFPSNPSAHLYDYAFGGAGVSEEEGDDDLFTLKKEVNTYLLAHHDKASEDSLYVIWIGGNNYLAMPSEVDKTLKSVNDGIVHSIKRLVEKGAKHFLVINLPDLGKTPAAIEFGSIDGMRHYSTEHNKNLYNTVEQLKGIYPDVEWLYYDISKIFANLTDNPAEYGFTNITGTCYNTLVNEVTKKSVLNMVASVQPTKTMVNCDGYLFFDLVHPTAIAHQLIAEDARLMLDANGVQFSEEDNVMTEK